MDRVDAPESDKREVAIWEIKDIHRFLEICDSSRYGDFFRLSIHTGLRGSEVAGLKWESVDLVEGTLRVENVLHHLAGHGLKNDIPKTDRSRITVILADSMVSLLHSIKGRQITQQMEYGNVWVDSGYVFTRDDGRPLIPTEVTREFCRIVKAYDLPYLTLHDLRHCYASLGLVAGVDIKIISDALGHSTIQITNDLYAHVPNLMKQEHANLIGTLLKRA